MSEKFFGICEACPTEGMLRKHKSMNLCDECWEKEFRVENPPISLTKCWTCQQPVTSPTELAKKELGKYCDSCLAKKNPVLNTVLETAKNIDASITARTDIFNAETVAIVDLKKAIDSDTTLTNKPFELAKALKGRFEHFTSVIFDAQKVVVESTNKQRAIQSYLNSLANQLRAEEREQIKVQDISYKPAAVKEPKVKTVTTAKPKAAKLDKAELKKFAKELGVGEFTLQSFVVARGCTVAEAAAAIKASIEAAKQG